MLALASVPQKRTATTMPRTQKTRNSETMTEAGLKNFIISLLRKSNFAWKPKKEVIMSCRTDNKLINEATGKPNMTSKCQKCGTRVLEKNLKIDHIDPIVPVEGWGDTTRFLGVNWNEYLGRMFVESDGLQGICADCHKDNTDKENKDRRKC